jgi:hypothetical protein
LKHSYFGYNHIKINHVGHGANGNTSEYFLTVNGAATGHEAQNPASYMMMIIIIEK